MAARRMHGPHAARRAPPAAAFDMQGLAPVFGTVEAPQTASRDGNKVPPMGLVWPDGLEMLKRDWGARRDRPSTPSPSPPQRQSWDERLDRACT
eukprot:CAMPEP_0175675244 /NCGR_PEP_ID=MMETSP0097-20121207/22128_1 /TAXON_ID=311494 /ORGANISM="Alexandrium monilatum, Strain CCMP3105" /LENGTH=93 /DNA_ID=CAMNT_0016981949 /DNA_START=101 /DNA_END=379 /DNA_ORIENTATION=-